MKSPWWFLSLCVHVAICVGQPSPVWLAAGGESSTRGSGTVALEYRVYAATATPPSFQLPRERSVVSKLAANAAVSNGGRKVTYEVDNPELENKLRSEWNDGSGTLPHYPKRGDWSTQVASNGPSLAAGVV